MNKDTFYILRNDAMQAIAEHRLGDALNALKGLCSFADVPEAADELETIKENYGMMLAYMSRGVADEGRKALFLDFLRKAHALTVSLSRAFELKESQSHYVASWKTLQNMDVAKSLPEICQRGGSFRVLFDVVWTSGLWRKEDEEAAEELLDRPSFPMDLKCLLLSAAMLGALTFFDVAKLRLLLSAVLRSEPQLRARALVGAIFVMVKWKAACALYPELTDRLLVMSDDPRFVTDLVDLQSQLLLSLDTPKIEHKVRDEILPEMMKNSRRLNLNSTNLTLDEMKDEFAKLSANPEWEGVEAQLADKVKSLIDMQQKGADVFIGSFKMFKQNFPFFSVAANWFYPFSLSHPDLPGNIRNNALVSMLTASDHLCESDKYSFCLMMAQMPNSQAAGSMLSNEQLAEMMGGEALQANGSGKSNTTQACIRSYVLDAYRYFKLYRLRDEQADPFKCDLLLIDHAPFDEIIRHDSTLRSLADFTFEIESYPWALKFYELLEPNAEILQKMGYCHQIQQNFPQAIEAYNRANLFKSDSAWTLRQLAYCHRYLGETDKALAYYLELENMLPEDCNVPLRIGECYIRLEEYDKALQKLYKAYYLSPDNGTALRAIAWCCLQTRQDEQAGKYYGKLLEAEPQADDFLNAGHAAWVSGNIQTAVERYRQYLKRMGDAVRPDDIFKDDISFLESRGLTRDDLCMMGDILRLE